MTTVYSTYEAKARFSELLRKVRSGQRVRISHHGREIAEIVPIAQTDDGLAQRLLDLESQGALLRQRTGEEGWQVGITAAGALERFLEERE